MNIVNFIGHIFRRFRKERLPDENGMSTWYFASSQWQGDWPPLEWYTSHCQVSQPSLSHSYYGGDNSSWKQINLKTFDQYILPWHKLRGNVLWKMSWYRILVELTMKQRISRHGFNCFWRCYNSDLEELIWKKMNE